LRRTVKLWDNLQVVHSQFGSDWHLKRKTDAGWVRSGSLAKIASGEVGS
jgi:hypothetical protein